MAVARIRTFERVHDRCPYDFAQLVCPLRILVVICGLLYAWLACGGSIRSLGWPSLVVAGAWLGVAGAWRVWGMLRSGSTKRNAPECGYSLAEEDHVVVVAGPGELRRILAMAERENGAIGRFRTGLQETQERVLLCLFALIVLGVRPMVHLTDRETGLIGLATYATACLGVLAERKRCVVSAGRVAVQTLSGLGVVRESSIDLAGVLVLVDYAEGIVLFKGESQEIILGLGDFWCPHRLGAAIVRASRGARCRAGVDVSGPSIEPGSAISGAASAPPTGASV